MPVCRFFHGSAAAALHKSTKSSFLNRKRERKGKARALRISLLAPSRLESSIDGWLLESSIDGWFSCNEEVPKQGPLQLNT